LKRDQAKRQTWASVDYPVQRIIASVSFSTSRRTLAFNRGSFAGLQLCELTDLETCCLNTAFPKLGSKNSGLIEESY
jgi:hypothetical protein